MHSWPIVIFISLLTLAFGLLGHRRSHVQKYRTQAITLIFFAYGMISSGLIITIFFLWHIHPIWGELIHYHPPNHITDIRVFEIYGQLSLDLFSVLVVAGTFWVIFFAFTFSQIKLHSLTRTLKEHQQINKSHELTGKFPFLDKVDLIVIEDEVPIAFTYTLLRLFRKKKVEDIIVVSSALIDLLTEEELEVVLVHEYAHIAENDNRYAHVIVTLGSIMKFDPMLRLFKRILDEQHEISADAKAVEITNRPKELASALLKLAEFSISSISNKAFFSNNKKLLLKRITILLELAENQHTL